MYKPCRRKGFFQFEVIINVLVSSLRVKWIPMSWVYGHHTFLIHSVRGSSLDVRIWRSPRWKGCTQGLYGTTRTIQRTSDTVSNSTATIPDTSVTFTHANVQMSRTSQCHNPILVSQSHSLSWWQFDTSNSMWHWHNCVKIPHISHKIPHQSVTITNTSNQFRTWVQNFISLEFHTSVTRST